MPLTNPKGNTIGVLQVLNREGGFSEADINLLRLAAAYAASALEQQQLRHDAETAKLLMRELEIAKEVQQRLFPQNLPKIEGMGYSAFCRPAQAVGGDYYDFIQLTPSHLAVTLGDVSGKGIPAAVFMASIQSSLRSHLIKAPNSLGRLMEDFNKVVCDTSTPSRYSTLVCCIVDISSRRLTYVNAGHVPPFLMRRSGTIERLRVGGPPVGLFAAASYEEESVRLEDGDLLFCCSDGFTEASNSNGEMWEEASVEGILQNQIGLAPPEVISNFVHTADQYAAGEDQADDMTLVVLQF
jgi:sigma-B regulation protein RsbU (phosphoserine phosphatase)